ncbi:protein-disulfide reductase DsbD family protein [Kaistia geumhonensis]|uniref:Suppressor for copper-sensitivity B n=1 Tax=Kaistia geumhonensis TaxID=410839 RepID=A0ABU0MBS5_9HYPH|nr:protein-disulfide reductase DsbD domain-containing protein [Kaistia geumhonensis]MCX5481189.1 protein-disulfide reductase DsbD family protein [Kaistia geumhonensis]MDQ0518250.1 suppressor for copper-sensitivity B [Kaistia geumhonensis]
MTPLRSIIACSILVLQPVAGHAASGDWASTDHVAIRLLAAQPAPGAPLQAAIEIVLDPGWKTYWRTPGDAGIPPRFDFSGSRNAGGASVAFPAPERSDDGFSVSNVYHDRVVLPVSFADSDPSKPVRLELTANLGICADVCVPIDLAATLDVAPGAPDDGAMAAITAAHAALPGPGRAGAFEVTTLRRVGGSDKAPEFEVEVATPDPAATALFVEMPPDWYPAPPEAETASAGPARYRIAVDRKTATTPLDGAVLRLTMTSAGEAATRAFRLGADGTATPLAE